MGFQVCQTEHAGEAVTYGLWLPTPTPARMGAVVFLHGRGECGDDVTRAMNVGLGPAISERPTEWPCAAVFPCKRAIDGEWFDERDRLNAVLDDVARTHTLDPDHLALTGISQGGRGTFRLATHLAWRFRAAAPVCGWCDVTVAARELRGMPVWAFHGSDDPLVPCAASEAAIEALRAAGGDARLTVYPGVGHGSWEQAYREPSLPRWLLGR